MGGQVWKPHPQAPLLAPARAAPQGSYAAGRARGEGLGHTLLQAHPGVTPALPSDVTREVPSQMGEALAQPGARVSCLARFLASGATSSQTNGVSVSEVLYQMVTRISKNGRLLELRALAPYGSQSQCEALDVEVAYNLEEWG